MAEVNLSGNTDIDGILWGYRIDGTNLTYSFPTGTGDYTDYAEIKGFEAFNADQQAAVTRILAQVSGVCGLSFTLATTGRATLRFAEAKEIDYTDAEGGLHKPGDPNDSAEANPPDPDFAAHIRGDCWFNRTNYNDPDPGDFAFAAGVMHEIGHALGLKHGHAAQTEHGVNFPVLPSDHDSQEYSIMTYRRYPGGPATGSSAADYPQTLMQNDIAALQYMYGADYGYNDGNNTYRWSPTTGEMFIDGVAQGLAPGGSENFIFLTIWDGKGIDTYDFSNYTTNLVVDLNPGAWSRVSANSNLQLADLGDGKFARGNIANALLHQNNNASLIERAIGGTGRDSITGNRADNELFGQAGDDTLLGGAGRDRLDGGTAADAMAGGAGDDTYVVDNVGDAVIEWSGEGIDTISAWISTWMPENTEMLRLEFDPRAITATGSFGNDRIEGNAFNNVINGSAGWDSMLGRAGNDTYYVENVFDSVVETYGEGTDTVISSVSFTLADNVETLRLDGAAPLAGTGNNWENTLVGNIGANRLNGAGGLDTLQGGLGDDTYVLNDLGLFIYDDETFFYLYDRVVEAANAGVDTVEVALVNALHFTSYLLPENVENGRVIGTGAFDLNGNALANALTGNGAVNRLNGGAGNDLLDGGGGEDTLTGGAGNDVFTLTDSTFRELGEDSFDFFYDAVVEAANGGIDTVRVARAWGTYGYSLPTHVENGVVIGTEAFDLTGNDAANVLTGNDAANVLRGGAGID
ncbi:MAG TPA: M10 family metallopeptidase, partial [Vicinamibacterales bacterium]|nr:M10 family metallopeptidase [Vicinamibacterales bacterium]